ncbi:Bug family tripartite tricarboxylate transporter substrate binding protein [Bordetella muralis]|uniref:Bug family tripartite tricarboxylate transporter substrate binding protein n=1 Tax=Bordetella muralis TaxID=1649130 RepID=UPI0039EE7FCD
MRSPSCTRRALLRALIAAGMMGQSIALASGQGSFPNKPVRLIVPFAPGGSTDVLTRLIGAQMSTRLKEPVTVENRTGASGNIAADYVAKAPPDGYTLVMGSIGTHATNSLIYRNMPYDPVNDFAPIALAGEVTLVLVVHPDLQVQSVSELVQLLKNRPGSISYASGGVGASQHLAAELFKYSTHTSMLHVPYKGSAGALVDLVSGRVPVMFADLPLVLPHIENGALRALAVCDPVRNAVIPRVQTMQEAGVADYVATAWYALFAPAQTPADHLQILQRNVADILQAPEVIKAIQDIGAKPGDAVGEKLRAFQLKEIARWKTVVKVAGISMDN